MRLHHVGIATTVPDKTLLFYKELLGFQEGETVNIGGVDYYFITDGEVSIEIEPCYSPESPVGLKGLSHLAIAVEDLDEVAWRLREAGVKFLLEPSQFRPDRRIAFVEDPNGVKIQLIQFLNGL